ncbi:MAG: hypothetical protein WDO73_13135 [Ignavibacteriota bacterium]
MTETTDRMYLVIKPDFPECVDDFGFFGSRMKPSWPARAAVDADLDDGPHVVVRIRRLNCRAAGGGGGPDAASWVVLELAILLAMRHRLPLPNGPIATR